MSRLIFDAAVVRRIVEHSLAAPKQRPKAYTEDEAVAAPSVLLVHDHGIYLMSNGTPGDVINPETSQHFIAHAEGCNPATDGEWWDTSRDLVGGDDFAETLPIAAEIKALIDAGATRIGIEITEQTIELVDL